MKILALMDYDQLVKVNIRDLQRLINDGKITAFRRSSGWVTVGSEPIRGCGGDDYPGPERREFRQHPPTHQSEGISVCTLTHDDWPA
jgi:hypothetical protein